MATISFPSRTLHIWKIPELSSSMKVSAKINSLINHINLLEKIAKVNDLCLCDKRNISIRVSWNNG